MNSRGRTCKIFFLLAAFWLFYLAADAATYYSRQSGAWNSRFTWAISGHTGGAAASFPAAGDIVYIGNHTVTVTANTSITQVFFNRDYQPGNLVINSGITLTVSGSVTVVSDDNANTSHTLSGAGTLNCSSLNVGTNIDPDRNQTNFLYNRSLFPEYFRQRVDLFKPGRRVVDLILQQLFNSH
ncbi:MAG: hypothetical protein IPI74_03400 [Bacteroidales bacterium]|nr:hypothetical protein [Bacteroidales bacterium]